LGAASNIIVRAAFFSAGREEPNALVTLGTGGRREPNLPATTLELADGMAARSQNRWPSLAFDIQSVNGLFSPLL
jgi:sarcosine oxidase subunit alpha